MRRIGLAAAAALALCLVIVPAAAQEKLSFEDVTLKVLTPRVPEGNKWPQTWDVAWVDPNGDGKLDILMVRGGSGLPNTLWLNKGDGTFQLQEGEPFASPKLVFFVLAVDKNADGKEDYLITNGGCHAFINETGPDGKLKFVDTPWQPLGSANHYGAIGDVNGDGKPDCVRCPGGLLQLLDLQSDKAIHDPYLGYSGPVFIVDFENDDWPEVLCLGQPNHTNRTTGEPEKEIFLLNHKGELRDRTMESGLGKVMSLHGRGACADFNNDGLVDILMIGYMPARNDPQKFTSLFKNNGDGTFTEVLEGSGIPKAKLGGTAWCSNPCAGDFNNDGLVDFVVEGTVWLNKGDFKFEKAFTLKFGPPPSWTHRLDVADYDEDGKLDILTETSGTGVGVWHNTTATDANWLKVKLRGPATNPEAVLARVTICEPGTQTILGSRQVLKDLSHDSFRPHFGLGPRKAVDVKVHFQHGSDYVFKNVAANQTIRVTHDGKLEAK